MTATHLPSRVPAPDPANWSNDDHAYFDAMESRRAASLRRRVIWCCIICIFLMMIGVLGHGMEMLGLRLEPGRHAIDAVDAPLTPNAQPTGLAAEPGIHRQGWLGIFPSTVILFCSTLTVVALCVAVLIYTVRTRPLSESEAARTGPRVRPGRHRLVVALSWLTLGAVIISVPAEMIAQWADLNWGSVDAVTRVYDEPDRAGYTATNAYGIFYLLACVMVPMRWRESLRIAGPGLAVLLGSIVFLLLPPWQTTLGLMLIALTYTVIATGWSAWRYADFDARLRAHALSARYTDLTGQVSEISAELREARRLHESLFPALAVLQGHPDTPVRISFRYEPARQIGGDFLDVYREPATSENTGASGVTIVVIDVSGHGVTAALAVNRLHGELRRFFARHPRAERRLTAPIGNEHDGGPGHLLTELNAYTCAALAEQGIFATAMVVHVAPSTESQPGLIRWASAGHPTGFLARPDGSVADLESTATMLGVLTPELFEPHEQALHLGAGDRLITYTDGAVESRDAHGEDYTPERLRKAVADLAVNPDRTSLLDGLMEAVRTHRHGRITDDTLLVEVAVVTGSAAAVQPL